MSKIPPQQIIGCFVLAFGLSLLTGCGGSPTGTGTSIIHPSILINPSQASLRTGASQQFSAAYWRSPEWGSPKHNGRLSPLRPSLAWLVNGIPGGNSVVGTINVHGMYTAPARLPQGNPIFVSASNGSSRSADVPVMVYSPGAGALAVSPSSLSFSKVSVGTSQTQSVNIQASGDSSVVVYTANAGGSGFSLSNVSFPITIPPGQTVSLTVRFAPQVPGNSTSTISFLSNAANSADVNLSGTGVSTGPQPPVPPDQAHQVSLGWNPVPAPVQGYYVYRGMQSGGPYARISSLQGSPGYVDLAVVSGQTYYYVVTSLSPTLGESGHSTEVEATIPTP
jgi:hypothetical protein